jgi:hypothetical protein
MFDWRLIADSWAVLLEEVARYRPQMVRLA